MRYKEFMLLYIFTIILGVVNDRFYQLSNSTEGMLLLLRFTISFFFFFKAQIQLSIRIIIKSLINFISYLLLSKSLNSMPLTDVTVFYSTIPFFLNILFLIYYRKFEIKSFLILSLSLIYIYPVLWKNLICLTACFLFALSDFMCTFNKNHTSEMKTTALISIFLCMLFIFFQPINFSLDFNLYTFLFAATGSLYSFLMLKALNMKNKTIFFLDSIVASIITKTISVKFVFIIIAGIIISLLPI